MFFFFIYFFQRRKFDGLDYGLDHHQLTAEQLQQLQDEADPMDWQTAALFLAVLACLLFFIVAACILVHHMRQWRRMERRLDQGKFNKRTSVHPSVVLCFEFASVCVWVRGWCCLRWFVIVMTLAWSLWNLKISLRVLFTWHWSRFVVSFFFNVN